MNMQHTPGPWFAVQTSAGHSLWTQKFPRMIADIHNDGDVALIVAAPELLVALRIALHHTHRAAGWTKDAYRRAIEEGMHGTADAHHTAWQDTLAAIRVIESTIAKTNVKFKGD